MSTITLNEAQPHLAELVEQLAPGEELLITHDNHPVAKLVGHAKMARKPARQLGTLQGTVTYMAPDFDAPPEDFPEYS